MANPAPGHSLGPTCAYYEEPIATFDEPPPVRAQFFYVSVLPIDDPLSPPPPSDSKSAKQHPQPFSARDNAALEEAWRAYNDDESKHSCNARHGNIFHFPRFGGQKQTPGSTVEAQYRSLDKPASSRIAKNVADWGTPADSQTLRLEDTEHEHKSEYMKHKQTQQLEGSGPVPRSGGNTQPSVSRTATPARIASHIPRVEDKDPVTLSQSTEHHEATSVVAIDARELSAEPKVQPDKANRRRKLSPFRSRSKNTKNMFSASHDLDERSDGGSSSDVSGRPFARVPSHTRQHPAAFDGADSTTGSEKSPSPTPPQKGNDILVPVGASRLHVVEMPAMLMKPIYWNPVNDISHVTRGTWFYQDSMLPVEHDVAVQLEAGYEAMRPWTEVWQEELNAIVRSNGADAELKAMHKLWPNEERSRPRSSMAESSRRALDGSFGAPHPDSTTTEKSSETAKPYRKYSVIYLNAKEAQLLKPSLLPSETRGRKPLGSIRKGRQIGIAVVRGFSRTAWEKLHGRQISARAVQAKVGALMNKSGDAITRETRVFCAACKLDEQGPPDVFDLVLVIHGIGQKLSERVDSYHFTHAINSFRREVNVEFADQVTKGIIRAENHGIMVLPINWRLNVNFDDQNDSNGGYHNDFRLKDITPDSLPTIRNLISDVMLDIPYYLSHHKKKMMSAVVREANRVYRLWCSNNPGFESYGRVHLLAHSLGSVMAMDILSKQPTTISPSTYQKNSNGTPNEQAFEFNTNSLFNCGSPGAFFLLLNRANLIPRKGRKAGQDTGRGIAGESSYGCLAVNNLYNIVHRNDPIAYQQNACVDAEYARSLLPAYIPSASTGFLQKIGNVIWWGSSSSPNGAYQSSKAQQRSSIQRLPSTVELETHNFTREEIAEKRMYLLNDNGQIDFFLNPGVSQYLDMLGAHSSYWVSRDFVRFLVMELGREQGKEGTLPVLRAQKKREWKRATIG